MKPRTFTLVLAAALAFSLAAATPGFSANDQDQPTTAKKTTRHKRTAVPQSLGYPGLPANSCDYDRAAGRCVIDLGYGRCMDCSAGPFN